jgi:L-malate glycosyltransferase
MKPHILILPETSIYKGKFSWALDQACALRNSGVKVRIFNFVLYFKKDKNLVELERFAKERDIEVISRYIRVPIPLRYLMFSKSLEFFLGIELKRIYNHYVKSFGIPDVIHAHNSIPGGRYARYLSGLSKKPYVITEHSSSLILENHKFIRSTIWQQVAHEASRYVCVSQYLLQKVKETSKLGVEGVVIPNLLPQIFETSIVDEKKCRKSNEFIVVCVGNLIKLKNNETIVRAFARASLGERKKLIIVGNGPEKKALEDLATSLCPRDSVFFTGEVSRKQIYSIFQSSDVFVHMSRTETFGVVLIEAIASKLPVISSDSGGSRDILHDSVLLSPDDETSLVKRLEALYLTRFSAIALNKNRKDVINRFGSNALVGNLTSLYQEVLK